MRKFGRIYRTSTSYIFHRFCGQNRKNSAIFLSLVLVKPVDCQWRFWRYHKVIVFMKHNIYETCKHIYPDVF